MPEILTELRDAAAPPVLDRAVFERLFQVGRRQAIRLMAMAGGYQVGKTYLVDRASLVRSLEAIGKSEVATMARERKRRIAGILDASARERKAKAMAVQIVRADASAAHSILPAAVRVAAPGRLEIRYGNAEELLTAIAELATVAAGNFAEFERCVVEGWRQRA